MSTARLDVDRPAIGRVVSVALGLLAATSFAAGYTTLAEVASWAGMGMVQAWLIPAVIDVGMVVLGLSAMVQRARRERAALLWAATAALVTISVAAQVAHAMTTSSLTGWVLVVAVLVACTPPVTTLVAAEAALRLMVSAPVPRAARPARRVQAVRPNPLSDHLNVDQAMPVQMSSAGPVRRTPAAVRQAPRTIPADRSKVVARAAALRNAGRSDRQIADELGVARTTLTRWLREADGAAA